MKKVRKASERGHINFGWLDTFHTFSFGNYFDPAHMGFKSLRVINEDFIAEGMGFDPHPHRDMEIITFMVSGSLAHRDSMGNVTTIRPGEIQVMSAGTGIQHSEYNPDRKEKTHMYQIWVIPDQKSVQPRYDQINYRELANALGLTKLLSPDGDGRSIKIHQQLNLHLGKLEAGQQLKLPKAKAGWVQMITGALAIGDDQLGASDGFAYEDEDQILLRADGPVEFLWFEFL